MLKLKRNAARQGGETNAADSAALRVGRAMIAQIMRDRGCDEESAAAVYGEEGLPETDELAAARAAGELMALIEQKASAGEDGKAYVDELLADERFVELVRSMPLRLALNVYEGYVADGAGTAGASPRPTGDGVGAAGASPRPARGGAGAAGASPRPTGDSAGAAGASPRPTRDGAGAAGASPRPAGDGAAGASPRPAGDSAGTAGASPRHTRDGAGAAGGEDIDALIAKAREEGARDVLEKLKLNAAAVKPLRGESVAPGTVDFTNMSSEEFNRIKRSLQRR